ncbi:hypothetical protein ACJIZ3_005223 [Penstemon smallii]|uniref:Uncharacterized protein n=1 Tax=Penstemon smallii TaxID=265156 RepID=A0ABD3S495_9LAMI
MAKRRRESDSDGASPETAAEHNPVFVDTSLDTHLALLVSKSDTVSNFKQKMVLEHMQCFPQFGEIKINSLKVKRRGNFYSLPDFMLVCSVFHGVKGNWFLSADASSTLTRYLNQNYLEPGTSDCPKIDARDTTDVNRIPLTLMSLRDGGGTDNNGDSEMTAGLKVKSLTKTVDSPSNYKSAENCMETESPAKKKRKMRHNDDVYHSSSMEPEVVGSGNSMVVDAVKEAPVAMLGYKQQGKPTEAAAEVSGVVNDQHNIDNMVAFQGTIVHAAAEMTNLERVNSQSILTSDNKKEDTMLSCLIPANLLVGKSETEPRQNVPTKYSDAVTLKDSNLSDRITDISGSVEDAKSDGKNIRKKKAKKAATDMDCKARKGVSIQETVVPMAEEMSNLGGILDNQRLLISDQRKVDTILESVVPDNSMAGKSENELGQNVPTDHSVDVTIEEPNLLDRSIDSSRTMRSTISAGNKKRKKVKKTAANIQDTSDLERETMKGDSSEGACRLPEGEKINLGGTANSQNLLASDKGKEETSLGNVVPENSVTKKSENGLGQNVPTDHLKGVIVKELNLSSEVVDSSGEMQYAKSDVNMKKRKAKRTAAKVQDTSNMEYEARKDEANEGTCVPAAAEKSTLNSQILLASDKGKEDTVLESVIPELKTSMSENELGQDIPPQHVEGVTVNESNFSARLLDTSGTMEDAKSDEIKRKKKKYKKTAAKVEGLSSMEHETGKGESEKMEEENQVSLNQDHDMMLSSYNRTSDSVDPDSSTKETSSLPNLLSANIVIEPIISNDGRKKKKKGKRSADNNIENSVTVQTNNVPSGSSVLNHSSTDHITGETGKTESILYHPDKDVSVKLSNSDAADANEKVRVANEGETDHRSLTQTEETLEDAGTGKKKTRKKNQSIGNSNAEFPVLEKEKQIMESNQEEKHSKITGNREKKYKSKRKKSQITSSDVQENSLIKDKKVDAEIATKENSTSFVNSEQKLGHVASSQVIPDKSEEKFEVHKSVVNTDHQGINFEQYFVHGSSQDKVGSGNKVKEATESTGAMETGRKVKKHGLPLVSNSTELQNSLKSNDQESENESRVKSARGKRDSALNSDQNSVISNSINTSVAVSGNGLIGSSPREMQTKEKKASLPKSSSGRSTTFLKNKGDKKLQPESTNLFKIPGSIFQDNSYESSGTHKTVFKTPQTKSLLTKPGSIFQDNSGEDFGDENGTVDSDATTCSPSDSSSQSGHSEGESDTSHKSIGNGSTEGKERSTMSKFDLSATKDMSMEMILRSSKQFKKAKKRIASSQSELEQNESQQIELVPESQDPNQ